MPPREYFLDAYIQVIHSKICRLFMENFIVHKTLIHQTIRIYKMLQVLLLRLEFFITGPRTVDQNILIHLSQLSWKESPRRANAFNFARPSSSHPTPLKSKINSKWLHQRIQIRKGNILQNLKTVNIYSRCANDVLFLDRHRRKYINVCFSSEKARLSNSTYCSRSNSKNAFKGKCCNNIPVPFLILVADIHHCSAWRRRRRRGCPTIL